MLHRSFALRLTVYSIAWLALVLAWSVLIGFIAVWLFPDQSVRLVVAFFLGMVGGWIITPLLLIHYDKHF